jgi:hypothetical protein
VGQRIWCIVLQFLLSHTSFSNSFLFLVLCLNLLSSQKFSQRQIQMISLRTASTMDTPRRILIDYTQRGNYNSRQGKQTGPGNWKNPTQKKLSDSSTAACAGASPLDPSQSPPTCFESMTLSFTSIDSGKVDDDDSTKLGFEAISFFLTTPSDDHDCQRRIECSKDYRNRFQDTSRIAQTLSPRRRRNAVMLWGRWKI